MAAAFTACAALALVAMARADRAARLERAHRMVETAAVRASARTFLNDVAALPGGGVLAWEASAPGVRRWTARRLAAAYNDGAPPSDLEARLLETCISEALTRADLDVSDAAALCYETDLTLR